MTGTGTNTRERLSEKAGAVREFAGKTEPSETFGILCPTCGGSLRIHEGQRSVRCEYCGSALYVTRSHGTRSFMMKPKITAGKTRMAALKYLTKQTDGHVKARHASIVDLVLINVPFWRMHGRLIGWVCGDRIERIEMEIPAPGPREQTVIKTYREVRHPYSKLVFKHVDWSTPACSLPHLGMQGISLKTRFLDWEIFDHGLKSNHNFALPMKAADRAKRDAYTYLTRLAAPTHATVSAKRFHMFDNRFSLYYYPVYFLRYRHNGRIYTITIDGNNGHIIRGDVPQRKKINPKSMFFVPAAAAFLAGTFLPLVFIAAGIVYIVDLVNTEGFLPPHRWLLARLNIWFGGSA